MNESIDSVINELEANIGEPEGELKVKKCISHLRACIGDSSFYIKGVGNAKAYSFLKDYQDETANRFLIGAFKSILDSLIASRLPHQIQKANSNEANEIWALTYLHSALEYAGLGDPRIHKARKLIAKRNDLIEDSVIYLDETNYIVLREMGYKFTLTSDHYGINYNEASYEKLINEVIRDTTSQAKAITDAKEPLNLVKILPAVAIRKHMRMLDDHRNFLFMLRKWANNEKFKLKDNN